ncbi:MAG: hypothetical protein RLO49_16010 [Rhodospirillales bacterium]
MFSPFPMPTQPPGTPNGGAAPQDGAAPQGGADIDDMRAKLEEMQRQLDSLSGDKK